MLPNLLRGSWSIPPTDQIAAYLIAGIISITVHEFMHAWSALKFGDDTTRMNRVNLNPANHFDPLGFLASS